MFFLWCRNSPITVQSHCSYLSFIELLLLTMSNNVTRNNAIRLSIRIFLSWVFFSLRSIDTLKTLFNTHAVGILLFCMLVHQNILFLMMYNTVAKNSATAKKINILSVSSRLLYLVSKLLLVCITAPIPLNSSFVSWSVPELFTEINNISKGIFY